MHAEGLHSAPPEKVELSDGTRAWIREVQPGDKALLVRGFAELSAQSRYLRFLTSKHELTEHEVRYLTELDGMDHFAIGAVSIAKEGQARGLGVARLVRMEGDPEVAEAAVAVVDDMQGKGLGKLLLHRLADAAAERGVKRFRCTVLADNTAMQGLLRELDPEAQVVRTVDGAAEIELRVPEPGEHPRDRASRGMLDRLLSQVARALVAVRTTFTLAGSPSERP
jgi:GNAT superfamily N-acetyltransferase